jgi:hypothetical protein
MAATRVVAYGEDKNRVKECSRLGSKCSSAVVATWNTFIESEVWADGHGYVTVKQNGKKILDFTFPKETE